MDVNLSGVTVGLHEQYQDPETEAFIMMFIDMSKRDLKSVAVINITAVELKNTRFG